MPAFEDERRRDDWIKGRYVRLENGQEWSIPLPRIELRLNLKSKGNVTPVQRDDESNRRFGDRFWGLQETLAEFMNSVTESTLHLELAEAVLPVATDLIQRNYDVSDEDVADLMTVSPGDDANLEMWYEFARIALGCGPKPAAAT